MQDAYTPLVFQRHVHQLRAVMIHNQPWFVAHDFARLIGAHRPYRLPRHLDPHQQRSVILEYASGFREEEQVISDAGAYHALFRFAHPEHRVISQWLSEVLVPTLHDYHRDLDATPQRAFMTWANQRSGVVKWQGEIWIARRDLPRFMAATDDPLLTDMPSWRRMPG